MPPADPRRRLFPGDRSAFVRQGPMQAILQPPVMTLVVYRDAAGTQLADVVNDADEPFDDSQIQITAEGILPEFYGPPDVIKLWLRPLANPSTPYPVYPVYVPTPIETGGQLQHTQSIPATVWGPIDHGLGYKPSAVSLFSADFAEEYEGFVVQHLTDNSLRIAMDVAAAGIALIS